MLTIADPLSNTQQELARKQLKNTVLFGGLGHSSIEAIVRHLTFVALAAGEVLFMQEQRADHVCLVSAGRLKLTRRSGFGNSRVVGLIGKGQTFAESVMFSTRRQYPFTATAVDDSAVWCIDAEHYRNLLHHSTDACFAILNCLGGIVHEQLGEIERLSLHTGTSRFIEYLLTHADTQVNGNAVVKLEAPKSVIASRLAIVPATFSRTLGRLSRAGLLEVHDTEIHLLDVEALRKLTRAVFV